MTFGRAAGAAVGGRAARLGPPLWRSGPLIWATKGRGDAAPSPAFRGRLRPAGEGRAGGGGGEEAGGGREGGDDP